METNEEILAEDEQTTKESQKKRKKKSKGRRWTVVKGGKTRLLRSSKNQVLSKETTSVVIKTEPAEENAEQETDDSPTKEPLLRVNELISEEEKKQIESHYYVDLTSVDKKKVKKTIFVGDKMFRCKLCQTAYTRLDKCQVGPLSR